MPRLSWIDRFLSLASSLKNCFRFWLKTPGTTWMLDSVWLVPLKKLSALSRKLARGAVLPYTWLALVPPATDAVAFMVDWAFEPWTPSSSAFCALLVMSASSWMVLPL